MDYDFRMKIEYIPQRTSLDTVFRIPSWIPSGCAETLEDAAFLSGAALSHLHTLLMCGDVPQELLRDRLALRAAEACMTFAGRPERASDLRDALHFMRPGDLPGPAGETYLQWRRAIERPLSIKTLHRALPQVDVAQVVDWLDAGQGAPVDRAAAVFEAVLMDAPRAEVSALILADAALAQGLGWDHLVPLLAAGLKHADLRKRGDDLRLVYHRAVVSSACEAVGFGAELSRGAVHLKAVAPKLRAKAAGAAVEMFLARDAVSPMALPLPDRAARRLCDRLGALGAVRELTGRDTFRLYGV
ncbi:MULTISPECIES: DUF1403 family protein [Pacificibacter]|uniref:DUF1403 family protein n=1 Tax=Pacificibacter TaxID=1042323 RepID=UPI002090B6E0|nr:MULTISPECIES: DUF1403 family protein [Pacificibacter]MDO6617065.1 DUF1403 family protein [Pacificibacter sp. 1_MG-2023]